MKLLADTSALLALLLREDQNHDAAVAFVRKSPATRFLMTELILGELVTRLRVLAGVERSVAVAREILRSRRYELVFVDIEVLEGSLERMARFHDKRLSLTDCASFEVMERLGIAGAFTFDRDFRDCGFRALP